MMMDPGPSMTVTNTIVTRDQAMHACLLIPDILEHIFFDIYLSGTEGGLQCYWEVPHTTQPETQPEREGARRSLAALSHVCRSFRDIALDVLWAELDNLEPLFTCLPQDLWTRNEDNMPVILRFVTNEDWSIFQGYACRVRVLGDGHSNIFGHIDAEFVHSIMGFSSQSLLVPNLRALHSGSSNLNHDLHSCVSYLLGPNLVCLRLGWLTDGFWTNITCSVLSGLSRHSPRLKVIELPKAPSQVIELALCGLPHIQDVSLALTHNETFRFHTTSALSFLRIRVSTLTSCGDIVEKWAVPCRKLYIRSSVPETGLAVERALCKLNNHVLCDGLESFLYAAPKTRTVDHVDYAFSLHTFTPLTRFSSLKGVHIVSSCTSLLDDDALGSLVKSWPCLEYFYIGVAYFWKTPPRITFQGLVTVVSSCPNLRGLGLVFDATKLDAPTVEKPGGGVCNTNITQLLVGSSPIEQPRQVAVSLSAILPCLETIHVEYLNTRAPDRDAREARWEEALECVGTYTLIRKQEGLRV
ncbi:hypothetical protein K503DRAFT_868468 [Rhizopogon vinicolor AM-OR11-026]|uniref:F-box domain-containing protein n=1 Tax=Rhizopogon vinicolor AM-OR11-026 TaxID=1314800 RepID=A0A1B7MR81_9AGAM|nr:hypothetical protein K503DRAFT_868468 [Rhizopogon vinicolor AM-OR11-026]